MDDPGQTGAPGCGSWGGGGGGVPSECSGPQASSQSPRLLHLQLFLWPSLCFLQLTVPHCEQPIQKYQKKNELSS